MINLYRAVKSSHLNQPFGFNLSWAKLWSDGLPLRPFVIASGPTCPQGYAPFYQLIGMKGHNGDDWMAYHGEPVYFGAMDGNAHPLNAVCYTEVDPDGGIGVDLIFQDPDTQALYQLKEWHLMQVNVHDGEIIKSGDCIGLADSTGASSGDHLHEGFKPLNSDKLEDKKYPDNGYTGAVDPRLEPNVRDYRGSSFILDILNLEQQLTLAQQVFKLMQQLVSIFKGRNNT